MIFLMFERSPRGIVKYEPRCRLAKDYCDFLGRGFLTQREYDFLQDRFNLRVELVNQVTAKKLAAYRRPRFEGPKRIRDFA